MPATDPWAQYETKAVPSDPWAQYEKKAPARKDARHGLKGPDEIERAETQKALGQAPNSTFGEQFMGTFTNDIGSLGEAAYNVVRHPLNTAAGVLKAIGDLPHDLKTDIQQGRFGKLSARTLELLLPQASSSELRGLEAAGAKAAGSGVKTAAKVTGAVAAEVGERLTPKLAKGFVKGVKARLEPPLSEAESITGEASRPSAATRTIQHLKDRGPLPPTQQAEQLARFMKSKGWTQDHLKGMTEGDWKLTAAAAGLPEPTPEVIQAARGQLSWRPSPRGTLRGPQ
jgi:hypothetical protein